MGVDNKRYFLQKVIYRLPTKVKASRENGVVVKFSTGFFSKSKYFEVFNSSDSRSYVEHHQVVEIDDFDKGLKIPLRVEYRLSCPEGREKMLVDFVGEFETPEDKFDDFIDKSIHSYYNDSSSEFIENLQESLKGLSSWLVDRVEASSGVDFTLKIGIVGENRLKDLKQADSISVVPKDIEKSIDIFMEYLLKVSDRATIALLEYNKKDSGYMKRVRELVARELGELSTQELLFDFVNKESRVSALADGVNSSLKDIGREIEIKRVKLSTSNIEKFQEVEVEVSREPTDRGSKRIVIKNRLQFELVDAGKYIDNDKPSLSKWARDELNRLYSSKLFGYKYIDFLVEFEDVKKSIEDEMRQRASKIGYTINQIISEPRLPENALLYMDTYDFTYTSLATSDSAINADFKVTVTFMLNDKKAFKELFRYSTDAKEGLEKIFEVELKKVLSYESPERIFLHYYNDKFQDSSKSLKRELEERISRYLSEKLDATIQDIHIVPVDNGLLKPLYDVRGESRDIEIALAPKIGGNPIIYKATLFVEGHDNNNWSKLIDGKYDMDRIEELVINTLQAKFNVLSEGELRFTTLEHRDYMENIADKLAKEAVSKRYGLIVEISNLDREKNREESLELNSQNKILDYKYKEKDENLKFLSQRNRQDREESLELSRLGFDEDVVAGRLGLEEIEISSSNSLNNTEVNVSSALLELAQDSGAKELLEEKKRFLIGNESDKE
jgi:hypothetical protein